MLVLCAGALAQARARARELRTTASARPADTFAANHRPRRCARTPSVSGCWAPGQPCEPPSFSSLACSCAGTWYTSIAFAQGCRGHWLARAPRAQGCRARALACARARAQGGTYVGGTRASVRARAHPPHLTCASGLTVWFKFKLQSLD